MADPFVQRMIARTQARRNAMGKFDGNPDKENSNLNEKPTQNCTNVSTSAVLKSHNKATDLDQLSTPLKKEESESKKVLEESRENKPTSQLPSYSAPSHKALDSSTHSSNSARNQRFRLLAQRTQQLEQWEDDYTYHSVSAGSSKEVETTGLGLHDTSNASNQSVQKHESAEIPEYSAKSETNVYVGKETVTSTYFFGEFETPNKNSPLKKSLISNQLSHVNYNSPQSPVDVSFHSANSNVSTQSPSPSQKMKSMFSTPLNTISKHSPPSTPKAATPINPVTPTRRLVWDRQLLKSLEAQGFTPSTSKSRLAYDFRDRSPIKDAPRGRSPTKEVTGIRSPAQTVTLNSNQNDLMKSPEKPIPPKIVTVQSKSKVIQHESAPQNVPTTKEAKPRTRDESPSKVSDLRSRWEQQIRNASPERVVQPSRSPSPTRRFQEKAVSTVSDTYCRPKSPLKDNYSYSSSAINKSQPSRPMSPSKSFQQVLLESFEPTAVPASNALNRGSASRASLRSASPSKPAPIGEVVKGETPMPETAPVTNLAASVREKAAAFSSVSGPMVPDKDPAELSVQDRMSLFEKKKGSVLKPKAPFGQCISAKAMQSSTASEHQAGRLHTNASRSYEAPKPSKPAHPTNKTYLCSRGFSNAHADQSDLNQVEARRKQFEHLEDDWRGTDINAKVRSERETEMGLLLNRFKKPRPNSRSVAAAPTPSKEDSDTEYPDSEDSNGEPEVFSAYSDFPLGPPKPPRSGASQAPAHHHTIPPPPPMPNSRSPSKRLNSTELDESVCQSPSKQYVPKVKPGCLFPSLSDIESHSEAHDSEEDLKDSSFAESVLTCASMDSLGTHIQKMAQASSAPPPNHLFPINERSENNKPMTNQSMSASTLEALEAIDDALDEAFDCDEPTPPKRSRAKEEDDMNCPYKTPKLRNESNSSSESSENNLAHSISMYRRQKPAGIPVTPVRQIIRKPDFGSPADSPISPSVTISSRIRQLQDEEEHQLTVISQASSAISVVSQHREQHGTMQHVEAEKLLLVATQKRQCALHEIQRLKAEGALGKRSYWTEDEDSCRGSISIGHITLPLKQDFLDKSPMEKQVHHFLVLVKHRDQVIASQLLTTPDCIVEGAVTFPNLMALHSLTADFNISLEVYEFKIDPQGATSFKKEHSRMKLTPLKRLHKESKVFSPAVSSPGGPYSIRSSSFTLIGFANLNINTLTRNAWTLEKVPFNSPMNGHLLMRVCASMEGGVSEKTFLTMFDDVGGYGAWNRRWCVLNGPSISYWSYPDDENKKESLGVLDLRMCTTRKVELVSRDVCARQFTFQLTFMRPLKRGDVTDLIHEVKGNTLITRILLSADSKEERILWCNKLNKSLANVRAWDPDSLKPEDFHV